MTPVLVVTQHDGVLAMFTSVGGPPRQRLMMDVDGGQPVTPTELAQFASGLADQFNWLEIAAPPKPSPAVAAVAPTTTAKRTKRHGPGRRLPTGRPANDLRPKWRNEVLAYVHAEPGHTAIEIGQAIGMYRTTVHGLLCDLVDMGQVRHNGKPGRGGPPRRYWPMPGVDPLDLPNVNSE